MKSLLKKILALTVASTTLVSTAAATPKVNPLLSQEYSVARPLPGGVKYDNPFTQFLPGVNHITGSYAFSEGVNYLVEGAERVNNQSKAIMVYMGPLYKERYPDHDSGMWTHNGYAYNLTQLLQAKPFQVVFDMSFQTIGIWAFSFSNNDNIGGISRNPAALAREEQEFYDLTKTLMSRYAGTNKTFILKNWETDNAMNQGAGVSMYEDIPESLVPDFVAWLQARQRGVTRARNELSYLKNVWVFNAVDVNKTDLVPATSAVNAYGRPVTYRAINRIVPQVGADMVSYSAWDVQAYKALGPTPQALENNLTAALAVIDQYAPDPMKLGRRRIFISEFGNQEVAAEDGSEEWRTDAVLSASAKFGLSSAFLWQVYDNECRVNGQPMWGELIGSPMRPARNSCPGFWLIDPYGNPGLQYKSIAKWWRNDSSVVDLWHEGNVNLINFLYHNLLGRPADPMGYDFWVKMLDDQSWTRPQVMTAMAGYSTLTGIGQQLSNENFIKSVYNTYLARDADPEGLQFWTGSIGYFTRQQILELFVSYSQYAHASWHQNKAAALATLAPSLKMRKQPAAKAPSVKKPKRIANEKKFLRFLKGLDGGAKNTK